MLILMCVMGALGTQLCGSWKPARKSPKLNTEWVYDYYYRVDTTHVRDPHWAYRRLYVIK